MGHKRGRRAGARRTRRRRSRRRGGLVNDAGQLLHRSFVLQSQSEDEDDNEDHDDHDDNDDAGDKDNGKDDDGGDIPAPAIAVPILGIKANIGCGDQETTLSQMITSCC